MGLLTSIYSWSWTSYGLFNYIMGCLALERWLRAISDHNLGRVLVGHNNGRGGQSVTESIRVVGLQGLPDHTCVMVVSDLKHVAKKWSSNSLLCHRSQLVLSMFYFMASQRWGSERYAYRGAVWHEDRAAWRDLGICKSRTRLFNLAMKSDPSLFLILKDNLHPLHARLFHESVSVGWDHGLCWWSPFLHGSWYLFLLIISLN